MKMRVLLLLLSVFFSLIISADRLPESCRDAWTSGPDPVGFPQGAGVNIHFTDARPGEIKMIADAGFRWVRMDFEWALTEKERGRYDFSPYDRLMASLEPHGIRALLILDYGNPLYTPDKAVRTEEARQAFARWAVAAAKHFMGRGIIWECFNEPNVPMFWPPKPDGEEYIALALAVGRAFRAAVPNEKLIGPATSLQFDFLEACFKAGLLDYWSAVSVHPYRQTNPEMAPNEYCLLREMISRYKSPSDKYRAIPIVSGEWGYSSVWPGMTEEKQAQTVARQRLTNIANGIPISIWYDWQDDGADLEEPEHHFGLVRHTDQTDREPSFQPKPSYLAAKTVNQFLDGFSFQKRLAVGSDSDYVLIFSRGAEQRIAAWSTAPGAQRVTIPVKVPSFTMMRYTGENAGEFLARGSSLTVDISRAPIYLLPRK